MENKFSAQSGPFFTLIPKECFNQALTLRSYQHLPNLATCPKIVQLAPVLVTCLTDHLLNNQHNDIWYETGHLLQLNAFSLTEQQGKLIIHYLMSGKYIQLHMSTGQPDKSFYSSCPTAACTCPWPSGNRQF